MWCRAILTAVAISYVICMLLWSGLQKDDLDASTLQKLARYNVNIDDMNNEQRRQECLLNHVTTEVQKETSGTSAIIEHLENDVTVGIYPKTGMLLAANFDDKNVIHYEANINKTKSNTDELPAVAKKMSALGNATNVARNKGIIKIEYNIQNQPDVESVMNFWTKLTRYTTTLVTSLPTVLVAPVSATADLQTQKAKNVTSTVEAEAHNNGYVNSREMEYISRILAEYLASQAVATTTQKVSTKKVFPHYVPMKYWKLSSIAPVEEKPKVIEPSNEINKINKVTVDLHSAKDIYNSLIDEIKSLPYNVAYDSTQLLKKADETPSSQIQRNEPKLRGSKPIKNNPIGILQRLLHMKNDLFNNGVVIPETESSTKTIKSLTNKSYEQQDTSESFHPINLFKNNVKDDQSTRASITAATWEPVTLSNGKISKELKASSKGKKETKKMQSFNTNKNRIEDIKKWKLQNSSDNEHEGSRFEAMLPSIKYSKQKKNNNQVIGMPTDFNQLQQNEDTEWFVIKKAIISQQPAAKEEFARNQLFKMKNDTFKADSGIMSKITQNAKEFIGKQIKKAPEFQKWEPTHDAKKIKAIQELINSLDRDNEPLTQVNESSTKPTQNLDSMNMSDIQGIPANIIKEIAEKVKQMVLKDIVDDVSTITMGTTSSTNSATEAPTTTISSTLVTTTVTSELPLTSLQAEFTQVNHVMQKLMEIFKELKAMKDTIKSDQLNANVSQIPQNTLTNGTTRLPQLPIQPYRQAVAVFNPYLMNNPLISKPMQKSSYTQRIAPVPKSSAVNPPQNKTLKYTPPLNVQPTNDYHFGPITIQTNSDEIAPLPIQILKPSKVMNQHIVLTTKQTIDKKREERERESMKHIDEKIRVPNEDRNHRQKIELSSDLPKHFRFAEKHEIRDRYSYRGGRYVDREKPWYNHEYHEKVHDMENTHPVRSRFPELHYPGRLSHLEHGSRPRDLTNSEDLSPPRGHNRPSFNEPGSRQKHKGSYGHSVYDRQPRYETTKFHEKLERIENWPRPSTWKDMHSPSDSSNDEISARQQMPLVKVKQRTRYDDSHFTNFLKSQQKVTDMLEKILANNVKNSGPHSVETP